MQQAPVDLKYIISCHRIWDNCPCCHILNLFWEIAIWNIQNTVAHMLFLSCTKITIAAKRLATILCTRFVAKRHLIIRWMVEGIWHFKIFHWPHRLYCSLTGLKKPSLYKSRFATVPGLYFSMKVAIIQKWNSVAVTL